VRRGEPLLELVDPEKLEVVAELLTPEAMQVRAGDRARIRGWGGPDRDGELESRVVRVSRAGFTKPSALGVEEERTEVVLELSGRSPNGFELGSEFHVEVEIETGRTPDALLVPVGSLFRDGDRWAAYVLESGRAEIRHVEVGRRNEESAEIVSGLKPGTRVVVYPGERVRAGLRIKSS
jgi:HlyD family secretion protein